MDRFYSRSRGIRNEGSRNPYQTRKYQARPDKWNDRAQSPELDEGNEDQRQHKSTTVGPVR